MTTQVVAAPQSTWPASQAPVPTQLTSQGRSGGQRTSFMHSPAPHSIKQVPSARQLVQAAGQRSTRGGDVTQSSVAEGANGESNCGS
jgi:hypothetical protein